MAEVPLPTPTQAPVPSTDIRNAVFAGAKLDEEVTGTGEFYTDRLGVKRLTNTGRNNQFDAAQLDRANRFEKFLLSSGYVFLGDYEDGPFQFSARNQYIRYDGQYYRLNSATDIGFTTTGTTSATFANDVTHFVLMDGDTIRQNLSKSDGFKLIGQAPSYAALKAITPDFAGQRILLASYYANGTTGGGEFMAVSGTATDDGGTVCVPTGSTTWYWQRVSLSDFNVSWFGAIGDSNTANSATNTTAIQNAMNAASSYGIATVRFPASTGFYACGTIYVPAGVTMMGSNRAKSLYGATVYLRKGSNAVVSPAFDGLWTKQSYFRLWDPDNTGSMISNVWFTNCLIDGTNLSLAGKTAGDAIQVKNTTFDVHLKGTYIQNYLGAGYSAVSDNTTNSYLATGVFCTLSQCKIFNCGYGIYIQGAAADSSDYHLDVVLLDHNTINLYVDGTRSPGMGECHVYAKNCRFEWATTYSIYNKDGFVNFDGWSLAPGSGGQKIFTSSNGKTLINGRLSGVAEGEDSSVDGNLVAHPGIISNLTYDKASPVVPLMLNNTTRGSTLKFQALKFKLAFSGESGFTFQNLVTYVSGNAPRFGIGGMYDHSVSAAVLDTTPVSVGSGNSAISATTQNSGISLIFGGGKKFAFVGMPSINRNTTGTAVNVSIQTDNTGTIIGIVFFNAATGAYVNPLSLTGEIQFSFVMFADL
ncbi:TPA: hypothetical protein ACQZJI_005274 [Klebsiella pneumoniae]